MLVDCITSADAGPFALPRPGSRHLVRACGGYHRGLQQTWFKPRLSLDWLNHGPLPILGFLNCTTGMITAPTSDLNKKMNSAVVVLFSRNQNQIPHNTQRPPAPYLTRPSPPSPPTTGSFHTGPLLVPLPGALLPGVCLAGSFTCSQGLFRCPLLREACASCPLHSAHGPPFPSWLILFRIAFAAFSPTLHIPCLPCSRTSPRRTGVFACFVTWPVEALNKYLLDVLMH